MGAAGVLILSIDAATRTGFALGYADERPRAWARRLKRPQDPREEAWREIGLQLRDLFKVERPGLIAVEAPMHAAAQRSADAVVLQWGVVAVIVFIAGAYGIRLEQVDAQKVSKHFTGKARWSAAEGGRAAKKAEAVRRCHLLGYMDRESRDDDVADACALWDYAASVWGSRRPSDLHLFGERAA